MVGAVAALLGAGAEETYDGRSDQKRRDAGDAGFNNKYLSKGSCTGLPFFLLRPDACSCSRLVALFRLALVDLAIYPHVFVRP